MDFTSVARRWNTSEGVHARFATYVNVGHYYSLVGWEDDVINNRHVRDSWVKRMEVDGVRIK